MQEQAEKRIHRKDVTLPSTLLILLILMTGCLRTSSLSEFRSSEALSIKVAATNGAHLHVELQNHLNEPLTLLPSQVPWEWRYALMVKAFETGALAAPLEENLHLADPGFARIEIPPRTSLSGKISLKHRFPEIEETLAKRDVLIFWRYDPQLPGVEPAYGCIVLPKGYSDRD